MIKNSDQRVICNELYSGQGLGNQLWNYAVTRVVADKIECDFSIISPERFKGANFINLDFGRKLTGGQSPEGGPPYWLPRGVSNYFRERRENLLGSDTDISRADDSLWNVTPGVKIDGNFQSVTYLEGYRDKIRSWIPVNKVASPEFDIENTCVIHVRCGDFAALKSVFLPQDYYVNAISEMRKYNSELKFKCVTDDAVVARAMLPDFVEIVGSALSGSVDDLQASHHIGGAVDCDFLLLYRAKYSIIPNSSFSWWATYLNSESEFVIAPKFWARYNRSDGFWSTSDIITPGFTYIDKSGSLSSADTCKSERDLFYGKNLSSFVSANSRPGILATLIADFSNRLRTQIRSFRPR